MKNNETSPSLSKAEIAAKYDNAEPRYRRTKEQIAEGFNEEWFAIKNKYIHLRGMANYRGILWEIPLATYIQIIEHPCMYGGKGPNEGIRITLDRINNALGYLPTNIAPSCWFHNHQRSNAWTHEQFLDIMAHYPTPCRNRLTKAEFAAKVSQ